MSKRAAAGVLAAVLLIVPAVGRLAGAEAKSPVEGVWQVADDGQGWAGLYIFTRTHYSMTRAAKNRPDIADTSKATAQDLLAMFGPLAANAGVYDIAGDLMTIHPAAAKFPVVMAAGATEVYAFRVEGKTLYLTQRRNARGVAVAGAAPLKLLRVE